MKKIDFDFIPPHFKCNNCGECCGPVPISEKEYNKIKKYCIENNIVPIKNIDIICPFRDTINKKCTIYEVRPTLCKLMGVTKGMFCPNGNTYELNGHKYIIDDMIKDNQLMFKLEKELIEEFYYKNRD